jgi:hypothetical protein
MIDPVNSIKVIEKFFRRHPVANLENLSKILDTTSRMSIFRRLKQVGYLSSYTHAGKYYTLARIPDFDDFGLWFHQDIGFSRFGTLKATIVHLVESGTAGMTHMELNTILRIRVHNALLSLVRENAIGRRPFEKSFVYVTRLPDRADGQLANRREKKPLGVAALDALVIEVLVEAIQASRVGIDAPRIAHRLSLRGVCVTVTQVHEIFEAYGILPKKKTSQSASRRLKP